MHICTTEQPFVEKYIYAFLYVLFSRRYGMCVHTLCIHLKCMRIFKTLVQLLFLVKSEKEVIDWRDRDRVKDGKPIAGGMEVAREKNVVEVRGVDTKEPKKEEEERRHLVCFGTWDERVGEGEGLLFSRTEGEERMGMRGKEKRKKREWNP